MNFIAVPRPDGVNCAVENVFERAQIAVALPFYSSCKHPICSHTSLPRSRIRPLSTVLICKCWSTPMSLRIKLSGALASSEDATAACEERDRPAKRSKRPNQLPPTAHHRCNTIWLGGHSGRQCLNAKSDMYDHMTTTRIASIERQLAIASVVHRCTARESTPFTNALSVYIYPTVFKQATPFDQTTSAPQQEQCMPPVATANLGDPPSSPAPSSGPPSHLDKGHHQRSGSEEHHAIYDSWPQKGSFTPLKVPKNHLSCILPAAIAASL
jgi:hypothetical protein